MKLQHWWRKVLLRRIQEKQTLKNKKVMKVKKKLKKRVIVRLLDS